MIRISILGYREDYKWIAHALDMDLIGAADTYEAALEELKGLIAIKVQLARSGRASTPSSRCGAPDRTRLP